MCGCCILPCLRCWQASFREYLKWDYELKGSDNLESVVDRALAIAESDPAGPVYITLPSEPMAKALPTGGKFTFSALPRQVRSRPGWCPPLRLTHEFTHQPTHWFTKSCPCTRWVLNSLYQLVYPRLRTTVRMPTPPPLD